MLKLSIMIAMVGHITYTVNAVFFLNIVSGIPNSLYHISLYMNSGVSLLLVGRCIRYPKLDIVA